MNTLFVTGTDHAVGKTVVLSALAAYWTIYCPDRSLGILKPIQAGVGDREFYSRLFSLDQSIQDINPIYFEAPLPPPIAAKREGRRVELDIAWQQLNSLQQQRDLVLIEAFGGLGSPLTYETTVADLAWDWRLPTVMVVPVRAGAIGQAIAHVALARQCRLHLRGIILNCVDSESDQYQADWAPAQLIQSLTQTPVIGCIPHVSEPSNIQTLAAIASNLDIERLIPNVMSAMTIAR
ncbi:MAG: dethiobiotin synthase [Elainellaceae cyanobacterium]